MITRGGGFVIKKEITKGCGGLTEMWTGAHQKLRRKTKPDAKKRNKRIFLKFGRK